MSENLNQKRDPVHDTALPIPPDVPAPDPSDEVPPHTYAIWLTEDVYLMTRKARPNAIRRFFLWAFFGWQWVKVKA